MDTKHTPGPWSRSGVRFKWRTSYSDHLIDSHTVGPDDNKGSVALIPYDPNNHADEDMANARLIASAPDLLDGHVQIAAPLGNEPDTVGARAVYWRDLAIQYRRISIAAITKATGQ